MNPTDVEARLRAMYAAKADAITDASLTGEAPAVPRGATGTGNGLSRSRARWLSPLLAAAATVAIVLGVVAITRAIDSHSKAAPAASLSVVPLPAGPGKSLRHGEEGSRADVPWRSVGRGWMVAEWADAKSGGVTVYLVNPVGGRYRITTVASEAPMTWSPDVRHVLFSGGDVTEYLDMVTGTLRAIPARRNVFAVGLLPGHYFGVLGFKEGPRGAAQAFGVLGPDGAIATPFPMSAPGAGSLDVTSAPIATPDGELAIAGQTGIALLTATGQVTRVLAPPAGSTACVPHSMWSASAIVASCSSGHHDTGAYLIPLDGSQPTRLVLPAPPAGYFGVANAWPMAGHTLVTLGTGCGPPGVELVRTDGSRAQLGLPRAKGTYGTVVPSQAYDTTIIASTTGARGCGGGNGPSLMSYDISTHKTTVLLGPGLNGGAVIDNAPWPGP
jgi:hypothetical protein